VVIWVELCDGGSVSWREAAVSRRRCQDEMLQGIVTADPATVKLDLVPINPEWILEGAPRARADGLASSQDDAICTMVWDGGAGRFRWLYADDEIVHITSGDVAIIDERTLSPGDMGLFPAGPTSTWHVPVNVRELAALTLLWVASSAALTSTQIHCGVCELAKRRMTGLCAPRQQDVLQLVVPPAEQTWRLDSAQPPNLHWWGAAEVLATHLLLRAPIRLVHRALRVTKRFITTGRLPQRPKPAHVYRENLPIIWKILNTSNERRRCHCRALMAFPVCCGLPQTVISVAK
jgi:uncharacterized protein